MGETPNKKYHITEDGDVYKVNDDGSFTSMGNAENYSKSTEKSSQPQDLNPKSEEEVANFNRNAAASDTYSRRGKENLEAYRKKKENGLPTHKSNNTSKVLLWLLIIGGLIGFVYFNYHNNSHPSSALTVDTDTVAVVEPEAYVEDNNQRVEKINENTDDNNGEVTSNINAHS
ncbi:MAG: hypothetical protein K2K97_05400 [Muribaculaceae bacterium]|nr:hypothetical protein [Muribaculaceae bacterium]